MPCDKQVRSCVLAAFYRSEKREVTIVDGNVTPALNDLQLRGIRKKEFMRAVNSLAFNADPRIRKLRRRVRHDGVQVFSLASSA